MGYQENSVILHTDDSFMPSRKLAWASWNFLAGEGGDQDLPLVTYCMNILQGLNSPEPFLVSLNAKHKINPEKTLREFTYAHPFTPLNPAWHRGEGQKFVVTTERTSAAPTGITAFMRMEYAALLMLPKDSGKACESRACRQSSGL